MHSLTTTHAAGSGLEQVPKLLHGAERARYADRGYWSERNRQACEAAGIKYRVGRRGTKGHRISPHERKLNRTAPASVREASTRSRCSSVNGATRRCGTRGSRRTRRSYLRCSPSPICSWCANGYGSRRQRVFAPDRKPPPGSRDAGRETGPARRIDAPKPHQIKEKPLGCPFFPVVSHPVLSGTTPAHSKFQNSSWIFRAFGMRKQGRPKIRLQ